MPPLVVKLPSPVFLVPGSTMGEAWPRKLREHPYLPAGMDQLIGDLNVMNRQDGVPATVDPAQQAGKDPSLMLYGRTYCLRLFRSQHGAGYVIAAIDPLRLRHHHRLARGCLLLRPPSWRAQYELRQIPQGQSAHWERICAAYTTVASASGPGAGTAEADPPPEQTAFLDTMDQLIDADERITRAQKTARAYPYRDVRPTGEQRRGAYPVYEFVLSGQGPERGTFVQVRSERGQRGQVTRTAPGSVIVRFKEPVDWDHIPRQDELEESLNQVVHEKQREAVALLRDGQSRNPRLLPVLTGQPPAPCHPAADLPAERLDPTQLSAFQHAVNVPDLMVVFGPPGTGKTRVISQIARACARPAPGTRAPVRVLVTSHTNRAVDNVLARLPEDLLTIRVGHEDQVTAEGQRFRLEAQAAGIRDRVLDRIKGTADGYADLAAAEQWAGEFGVRLSALRDALAAAGQARTALTAARRAAAGPKQVLLDKLTAEQGILREALDRNRDRIDRITQRLDRARAQPAVPLLGFLYWLLGWVWDRQLTGARTDGQHLHGRREDNQAQLDRTQREVAELTRHDPAVQAAQVAVREAGQLAGRCRADAFAAAQNCHRLVASMDTPPPLAEGDDQQLWRLQSWLADRLPQLAARVTLLADWQREVSGATSQLYIELVRYADVVAATCIGTASRPELSDLDFDLAIVDEAGQIGAANVLVPLVRARRCVLVGDHQQLPPYLETEVEAWGKEAGSPAIQNLLAKSMLEILVGWLPQESVIMLTQQRRMPAAIARFISHEFYSDRLETDSHPTYCDPWFASPMAFVDTGALPARQRGERPMGAGEEWGQTGYTNPAEAELLAELAAYYHRHGTDWAIIVPYKAQVKLITDTVTRLIGNASLAEHNVGTVDAFQGGERDVLLYGFTRSNATGQVGFLRELRRANVAFTRARGQLIMAGDLTMLTSARDRKFRDLAGALHTYLAAHGDIRPYREIRGLLARETSAENGDQ